MTLHYSTKYRILLLSVFFSFIFLVHNSSAQRIDSSLIKKHKGFDRQKYKYSSVTKTNPYTPFWGPIILTSEYRIIQEFATNYHQSLQLGASYLNQSLFLLMYPDSFYQPGQSHYIFRGYRLQASYKFYLLKNKPAPYGIYLSPHISYSTVKVSYKQVKITENYDQIKHLNINILFGYQIISRKGFSIDVFTGLGYKNDKWEYHNNNSSYTKISVTNIPLYTPNSNFKFTLGFNAGWAF